MADVFLLPGAVGLAILDSFAAGLPLLTTELSTHGPEISYLSNGSNGLITPHQVRCYADATIKLLQDPQLMGHLRAGANESGYQYSIENMVRNFRDGILECLALRPARFPFRRKADRSVVKQRQIQPPWGQT
jgi:L-malate glycosyltransferase